MSYILVILLIPAISFLKSKTESDKWLNLAIINTMMYVTLIYKAIASPSVFTASMILVNVSGTSETLGRINGVGQTGAALVRSLGPNTAGIEITN